MPPSTVLMLMARCMRRYDSVGFPVAVISRCVVLRSIKAYEAFDSNFHEELMIVFAEAQLLSKKEHNKLYFCDTLAV